MLKNINVEWEWKMLSENAKKKTQEKSLNASKKKTLFNFLKSVKKDLRNKWWNYYILSPFLSRTFT